MIGAHTFCQFIKSEFHQFLLEYPIKLNEKMNINFAYEKKKNQWVTIYDTKLTEISNLAIKKYFSHLSTKLLTEEDLPTGWPNSSLDWKEGIRLLNFRQGTLNDEILFIVDPVDGTRELVHGIPECVYSLCCVQIINDEIIPLFSWIWNFLTDEEFSFFPSEKSLHFPPIIAQNQRLERLGFIGHWEYNKILEKYGTFSLSVRPIGSIAYKLALLSVGKCDFVFTLRPKNIWDIAAGIHLLAIKDFCFIDLSNIKNSTEIKKINQWWWPGPMLWCNKMNSKSITEHLSPLIEHFNLLK